MKSLMKSLLIFLLLILLGLLIVPVSSKNSVFAPHRQRLNKIVLVGAFLVLLYLLVSRQTSTPSSIANEHPLAEYFRFEVSPGKSSYDSCCGKGYYGLSAPFEYTADIDMNRLECPSDDYKDKHLNYVLA